MPTLKKIFEFIVQGVFQLSLLSCAVGATTIFHSFSFDTFVDSPGVDILDYRYGQTRNLDAAGLIGIRANPERVTAGETFPAQSTGGSMPKGEFLYVKWRLRGSTATYEDTVDLNARLSKDITDHGIHFVVREKKLYVYLIPPPGVWPALALKNAASNPQAMEWLKRNQIYPDL